MGKLPESHLMPSQSSGGTPWTTPHFVPIFSDEGMEWQDDAACRGANQDLFFPERGQSTRKAKSICRGCAVRVECLDWALDTHQRFGIWGAMSDKERSREGARRRWEQRNQGSSQVALADMTKVCPDCGEAKPLTADHWYFRGNRDSPRPYCRPCYVTRMKRIERKPHVVAP